MGRQHRAKHVGLILGLMAAGFIALPSAAGQEQEQKSEPAPPPEEAVTGRAKLIFILAPQEEEVPIAHVTTAVLVNVERKERTRGAVRRWPGDDAGRYEYIEVAKSEFRPCDLEHGILVLPPGFYRLKHNSVRGDPPAGMYGQSGIFEIKIDKETEVRIFLYPAI
ncbi:MAG: hypothetical protein JW747_03910 [Candidatus Aminicenantes bacterium]|nr:hypothetical protein [Candidatus Aminicenantes bacterium]